MRHTIVLLLTFIAGVLFSLMLDSIGYCLRFAGTDYTYTMYAQESEIVISAIYVGIVLTVAVFLCMIHSFINTEKVS